MGFGTLFFGYFLLINNVVYCGFTDPIAALIMLLGLYKLSSVNRYFRYAAYMAVGFAAFSLVELGLCATELFLPSAALLAYTPYVSMARSAVIAVLTATLLRGIWDVAEEVELDDLAKRAKTMVTVSAAAYAFLILMDTPLLISGLPTAVIAVLSLVAVLGIPVLVIVNLTVIHGAYMYICMPDEKTGGEKRSRFAFVNEYRRRKAEKDAEYIEYAREKARKRREKKGK